MTEMNDISLLFKRRSIRRFINYDVTDAQIEYILKAGMNAQSAADQQPWQFLLIKDKETLKKLRDQLPYSQALESAPLAIIVCGDLSKEVATGFWVQDCAICTHNMCLASKELGLGSCWIGVTPVEERVNHLKQFLSLPDEIIPFSILAIGYSNVTCEPNNKFVTEVIHYEKW